jgi:hypothetical protein
VASFIHVGKSENPGQSLNIHEEVERLQKAALSQGNGTPLSAEARAAEPERFTNLVAQLERSAASRLKSPARDLCLEAYHSSIEGFEVLVARAHEKARSNPVGLLIAMVRNGEHLIAAPTDLLCDD